MQALSSTRLKSVTGHGPQWGMWPESLFVMAVMAAVLILAPLNTDAGYALVVARRLMAGDRLYVDIIETNPPLVYWIYEFPAFIGGRVTIRDDRLVGAFVAGLFLVSCVLATLILQSPPRLSRAFRSGILWTFALAIVLPFVGQVGQREQIAAILFFPYTLIAAREIDRRPTALWLGTAGAVLAATGIAIKPFFLPAWLAVEIAVFTGTGRWNRRDLWIILAIQLGYGIAVLVGSSAYLEHIIPLARAWYGAYGTPWTSVISTRRFGMLALAAIAASAIRPMFTSSEGAAETQAFSAATIGWLMAYAWQSKGWYYHLVPALVYATLALTVSVLVVLARMKEFACATSWPRRAGVLVISTCLVAACAWLMPIAARVPRTVLAKLRQPYDGVVIAMTDFVTRTAVGEPVCVMSTDMWPAFPVVNLAGATMPYRYHFMWPIPALYARAGKQPTNGRAPDQQDPLERAFFDAVVSDLVARPPRVLIVNRDPHQQAMNGVPFDFVAYFSQSSQFRELMQRYQRRGSLERWDLFELR